MDYLQKAQQYLSDSTQGRRLIKESSQPQPFGGVSRMSGNQTILDPQNAYGTDSMQLVRKVNALKVPMRPRIQNMMKDALPKDVMVPVRFEREPTLIKCQNVNITA